MLLLEIFQYFFISLIRELGFILHNFGLVKRVKFSRLSSKTMTDELDKNGKLLPDEIRLTKIGQLVRSLSVDELPQLFNVPKGDISLVEPGPLLP